MTAGGVGKRGPRFFSYRASIVRQFLTIKSDMTEAIPYTLRSQSSRTPFPHGMKATCHNCGIKKPRLVHVGSWMERDCPFFIEDKGGRKGVVCDFIPDTFTIYNSR